MQYSHHCEHLLERLNKQREAGFLCDCTVVIGECQFKAHRNVLASFSEFFGAFYRDATDSTVVLDQTQVKADGFQKLLEFIYTGNLNLDRKHSGEKPYVCDRCGQRFAQASTLTYHVRRHTGEKPYVCDTCGKAFAVSSSLITHSRKHTGEKPYICGICGKSFISSGELNKHFRSHTGSETPPDCNTLDNSFNEQESLQSQKSPLSESVDVKPSEMSLPLPLPIGTEDHQMLLPVAGSQSPSSETLLRSAVTGYSEPQFIFLQQLY